MPTAENQSSEMVKLEIVKGTDAELCVGGLRLKACRREVGTIDGGVTLYVYSDLSGDDREYLRIDLFRKRPHYHAPADNQAETKIEAVGDADARAWGIDAMTTRAPELVAQAGFDEVVAQLDRDALAKAGPAIHDLFEGLAEPTEVSYFDVPKSLLAGIAGD